MAQGGRTTISQVGAATSVMAARGSRGRTEVDLVLLDHGINDEKAADSVPGALEDTVRAIRCHQPEAQIVILTMLPYRGARRDQDERSATGKVARTYAAVARHYDVPLLSVYKADQLGKVWQAPGAHHCGASTHHWVADLLAYLINKEMAALEREPQLMQEAAACRAPTSRAGGDRDGDRCADAVPPLFRGSRKEQAAETCVTLLSGYFANVALGQMLGLGAMNPTLPADGSWRFFEDRPGKPGWISETSPSSWIEFPLSFGAKPRLTIIFLKSYEKLGRAEIRLDGMTKGYLLEGIWQSDVSQVFSLAIRADLPVDERQLGVVSDGSGRFGFGAVPRSKRVLQVRLASGPKWKITSVTSC